MLRRDLGSATLPQVPATLPPGLIDRSDRDDVLDDVESARGTTMEERARILESLCRMAAELTAAGYETAISGTYPLHPSTLAFHRAQRYQPRAVCLEVRRDLLVDQFVPFVELQVSTSKVSRVVSPLARALRASWT